MPWSMSTFWSIFLEHFIKHKPLFCEEWPGIAMGCLEANYFLSSTYLYYVCAVFEKSMFIKKTQGVM